jgi:hypothetical protein
LLDFNMSGRKYLIWFWAMLALGFVLRAFSLPSVGFFCDVPNQITAIESKSFLIQFPGYAPFHLVIAGLAKIGISTFHAMALFSFLCGMVSLVYVMFAAREAAGEELSLLVGLVMAFGIMPLYFSVVGTSYTTDLLFVSGMLYHGLRYIRQREAKHYFLTVAWIGFGIVMRPVSAAWALPALGCLLYLKPEKRLILGTVLGLFLTAAIFLGISLSFYGSFSAMLEASRCLSAELAKTHSSKHALANLVRVFAYPAYGFHLWLLFGGFVLLRYWRQCKRPEYIFLLAVVGPYWLLLLRYIPHAGYYCLVTPALALFPIILLPKAPAFRMRFAPALAVGFLAVSLCQWFLVKQIPTTNIMTGTLNAYVLQYSRAGVRSATCETLTSILRKNGLLPAEPARETAKASGM